MSTPTNLDKTIFEVTKKESLTLSHIQLLAFELTGKSKEEVEQAVRIMVVQSWLLQMDGKYQSNPDCILRYPDEFLNILPNYKAIHKVVMALKSSWYPNLTFDEFYVDHLERSIQKNKVKEVVLLAYKLEFVDNLPCDLSIEAKSRIDKPALETSKKPLKIHWWHKLSHDGKVGAVIGITAILIGIILAIIF